jgi:hypothetical protein
VRKKRKGGRRLKPGMRRRKYIVKEKIRSAVEEKLMDAPNTTSVGSQSIDLPNLTGLSQSHIPMAAMTER